jgi:hypothetical protein
MPAIPLRATRKNRSRETGGVRYRRNLTAESPYRPSSRPRSPRGDEGKVFKAGETVRETGIYEVLHEGAHRTAHEVVLLAADAFPPCETCSTSVRFRLLRAAPYIFQDEDFEDSQR